MTIISHMPPVNTELNANPKNQAKEALEVSKELEVLFLAEMLKAAEFGKSPESFNGGAGEDQFSSLLVSEQARLFSEHGGIGLAEHIFKAMSVKDT